MDLHGHVPVPFPTPLLERLSDDDLERLNALVPWQCFTADARGRRLGSSAWTGKRTEVQEIPDRRLLHLNSCYDLSDRHVLEIGCFEGVHTTALCRMAKSVTAVDARVENVVKTIVRTSLYGFSPSVFVVDVDHSLEGDQALRADAICHIGVLYHLADPVRHLQALHRLATDVVLIDTHVAPADDDTEEYEVDGVAYRYRRYLEGGREDAFSGTSSHSKWLTLETLTSVLVSSGFEGVDLVEKRDERNGPRVLLHAWRRAHTAK
jgi:tRNA (mo5U34)-methyltransferase